MKKRNKISTEGQSKIITVDDFANFSRDILEEKIREATLKFAFNIMSDEVERLCGKMFEHKKNKNLAHRGGSEKGYILVNGQKISLSRPRVRGKNNKEINLKSYESLSKNEISEHVFKSMLAGISCRKYKNVLVNYNGYGVSKSTVSRRFIEASSESLKEINSRTLDKKFWALFIDGIGIASTMVLVALGVDEDGKKHILGLVQGSNEDSLTVSELLTGVLERFTFRENFIAVIDGSKAIRKALTERFGNRVEIQRCYIHKVRNIESKIPKKYRTELNSKMSVAIHSLLYDDAKTEMLKIRDWLSKINLGAAQSLEEGLEHLLTIHRLEMPAEMRKSFYTTNIIESAFSSPRFGMNRVKNWNRQNNMVCRFAASTMLEQEKAFRKVNGSKLIPVFTKQLDEIKLTSGIEKVSMT
jgi:transposase-like protein